MKKYTFLAKKLLIILIGCSAFYYSSCKKITERLDNRAAVDQLQEDSTDIKNTMSQELAEEGIPSDESIEAINKSLENAANNSKGSMKKFIQIIHKCNLQFNSDGNKVMELAKNIDPALDYSAVTSVDQMEDKTSFITEYLKENAILKNKINNEWLQLVETEFKKVRAPQKDKDEFLAGFKKKFVEQIKLFNVIRDSDKACFEAVLKQHKLITGNIDQFTCVNGEIAFEDDSIIEQYNILAEEISKQITIQTEAQQKALGSQ